MSDVTTQLEALRAARAALSDPVQQAALDTMIANLEAQQAAFREHTATAQDHAHIGAMVSGDVDGDLNVGPISYGDQIDARDSHGFVNRPGGPVTQYFGQVVQQFFTAAGDAEPSDEQRELLESYLDTLARRCDTLRLRGIVEWERKRGKAPGFTLQQVYITLAATEWITLDESADVRAFEAAVQAGDPDEHLPQDARRIGIVAEEPRGVRPLEASKARYQLQAPLLLTQALSERRQIVLLGGPGSGKSTFLRHLAVSLAHATDGGVELPGWSAGTLLPIYVSLGGYAAWVQTTPATFGGESLWRYILTSSEEYALEGLAPQIRRAFRNGRVLLLLDGLDEVADPATRAQTSSAVAALAEQTRGFIAVTCRIRSFSGDVAEPFAAWSEPVTLAPFTLGQIKQFVRGWYSQSVQRQAMSAPESERRASELIERIAALPQLRDLSQTPLLLTIITILHFYEGKLPEDRADLYEDIVQLLLTRWTQQRREAGAPPSLIEQLKQDGSLGAFKDFHLRNVLEQLAYRAHQSQRSPDGRGLLDRAIVRDALQMLFRDFELAPGPAAEKAELVLAYLEDESGLLQHEGNHQYVLPHLTYEEYLAGCYLVKETFLPLAYQHWQEDSTRWREVILLAVGRMVRGDSRDTAAQWLDFLLLPAHGERERDDHERQQAALLAAECLADLGGKPALIGTSTVSLPQLWERLAQTLAEIVEGMVLPAEDRARAGVFVGELGDPRPGVCTLPPTMVPIAGGNFVIGMTQRDIDALPKDERKYFADSLNEQPVAVSRFAIGRYLVTNAQFTLFLDGGYDPDAPWWDDAGRAWLLIRNDAEHESMTSLLHRERKNQPKFWDDPRFGIGRPNHPVVSVTWYEAQAFCRWLSHHPTYNPERHAYRLPTEAEWEWAARGAARRSYPWGDDEPDRERANYDRTYGGTTAVGCFPGAATPEGVLDLTGNVWEWTGSVYAPYPYATDDGREQLTGVARKRFTLRGGSWFDASINLRAAVRFYLPPDIRYDNVGFRLATHLPV